MAYDGKLLARAKTRLDEERRERESERARRLREVYEAAPDARRTDARIRVNMANAVRSAVSGDTGELARARAENRLLQHEREMILVGAGFPADYTEERYACEKCRDTGYVGTELCTCLRELYMDEQRKDLSALLKLGDQTFDSFSLDWYDAEPDPGTGVSAREAMETVYETCVNYARKFGERSRSLFFTGETGVGKTFLAACIARVVSEKGFSVVYDTAVSIFGRFEEAKFSRDAEEADDAVRRYLTCDLLIFDDLGTEMTTSFTLSALYELVNTRLNTGKKTIVTSNLPPDALYVRYSPQIASRMTGEYLTLRFFGGDIRLLKNSF
ncbi:MAG: ATP-binding protein [Oscillospiraceae bacterium]|nr:ATP-binding protein [Oscillospiraceae bacterium]